MLLINEKGNNGMNLKEQYKHLLNYGANLITLLVEGLCFGYIWYTVYEEQFGFWRRGNWAVVGLYVLVIFFFTKVFGGYNIGYMRMTDIALSHILHWYTFCRNRSEYDCTCKTPGAMYCIGNTWV